MLHSWRMCGARRLPQCLRHFVRFSGSSVAQVTQARDDQAQAEYLASLLIPGSGWDLYVAEHAGLVVGFVFNPAEPRDVDRRNRAECRSSRLGRVRALVLRCT